MKQTMKRTKMSKSVKLLLCTGAVALAAAVAVLPAVTGQKQDMPVNPAGAETAKVQTTREDEAERVITDTSTVTDSAQQSAAAPESETLNETDEDISDTDGARGEGGAHTAYGSRPSDTERDETAEQQAGGARTADTVQTSGSAAPAASDNAKTDSSAAQTPAAQAEGSGQGRVVVTDSGSSSASFSPDEEKAGIPVALPEGAHMPEGYNVVTDSAESSATFTPDPAPEPEPAPTPAPEPVHEKVSHYHCNCGFSTTDYEELKMHMYHHLLNDTFPYSYNTTFE